MTKVIYLIKEGDKVVAIRSNRKTAYEKIAEFVPQNRLKTYHTMVRKINRDNEVSIDGFSVQKFTMNEEVGKENRTEELKPVRLFINEVESAVGEYETKHRLSPRKTGLLQGAEIAFKTLVPHFNSHKEMNMDRIKMKLHLNEVVTK